jgi:hypothetical protein
MHGAGDVQAGGERRGEKRGERETSAGGGLAPGADTDETQGAQQALKSGWGERGEPAASAGGGSAGLDVCDTQGAQGPLQSAWEESARMGEAMREVKIQSARWDRAGEGDPKREIESGRGEGDRTGELMREVESGRGESAGGTGQEMREIDIESAWGPGLGAGEP